MTAGFFFIIPQLGESENDICQSFGMNLHQRSKGAQQTAQDTHRRSHRPHLLQGDFLTDVLGFQDVISYLCNHGRKVKGDAALEVQVEAAEIDIGGADTAVVLSLTNILAWIKPGVYSKMRTPALSSCW